MNDLIWAYTREICFIFFLLGVYREVYPNKRNSFYFYTLFSCKCLMKSLSKIRAQHTNYKQLIIARAIVHSILPRREKGQYSDIRSKRDLITIFNFISATLDVVLEVSYKYNNIQIGIIGMWWILIFSSFPIQPLPHAQFLLPTSQHLISNRHRDVLIYNGIILWEKQCKISLVCLWSLVWREGIYSRTQLILDPIFWFHVFKINSVQN